MKHSRQVIHDSIPLQIDPKYTALFSSWKLEGVGTDLILSPNERKQISFVFNPSMGEEGAGRKPEVCCVLRSGVYVRIVIARFQCIADARMLLWGNDQSK